MRPQARCAARVTGKKAGPRFGQAQQPQRVAGRGGIEHDVVEIRPVARQQPDKRVERRDLGRAGARQLLLHVGPIGFAGGGVHLGQHAQAIRGRRILGIDIHRKKPRHARNRPGFLRQFDAEHLVEIGGGIGADQQHAQAAIGKGNGACATERGFANTALAGKKQIGFGGDEYTERGHGGFLVGRIWASLNDMPAPDLDPHHAGRARRAGAWPNWTQSVAAMCPVSGTDEPTGASGTAAKFGSAYLAGFSQFQGTSSALPNTTSVGTEALRAPFSICEICDALSLARLPSSL